MTGTSYMAKEVYNQPKLWKDTYDSVLAQKGRIASFLHEVYKIKNLQIILAGAGSSAFIGEMLLYSFYKNTGMPVKAIPTTDLVTHPHVFFQKSIPTLLISFARSGDSPESLATIELAEKLNDTVYHLVISCNPEGELVKKVSTIKNAFIFLLPEEANDQALAMTSSFTSMTLAGLLISDIDHVEANEGNVEKLIAFGKTILGTYDKELKRVAGLNFKRIVFLGSGPFKGAAKESHLKAIELTDGQIICQFDSFLGFRHGPQAIIDESTLLVYLFSGDPYVYSYEIDLVKSINRTEHFIFSIGIAQSLQEVKDLNLGLSVNLATDGSRIADEFFAICGVIPAQILGFYKSMFLGLTPDSPSQNGGIHRIVQGVTIYPY